MTDEELAAIRELLYDDEGTKDIDKALVSDWASVRFNAQVIQAGRALLAEVERLREIDRNMNKIVDAAREELAVKIAQNAAMREIVQAVAAMRDDWFVDVETSPDGEPEAYPCPHCGVDLNIIPPRHASDCPVTKARALLAGEEVQQ